MNVFLKLEQIRDILFARERNWRNLPEQITSVVYLHAILFIMHGRDTATETEFDAVLQITLEHILTQRFKESKKWTAKVTNITNTCKCRKTPLEECCN